MTEPLLEVVRQRFRAHNVQPELGAAILEQRLELRIALQAFRHGAHARPYRLGAAVIAIIRQFPRAASAGSGAIPRSRSACS